MGLLDEAIREHLDLKRRRGADPTEVERAEREALGPVRRNREAAAASEPGEEVSGGVAYDQAEDEGWLYDAGDDRARAEEGEVPPLELSGDEAPARSRRPDPAFDKDAFGESAFEEPSFDGPAHDDEPADPVAPPGFAHGATGGETTEFDASEAKEDDEEGGEDMLEETPEFLQDTPDHDRLWFEQRPPKDFDFDG